MFSNGKDKQTKKQTHKLLTTEPPRDHHGVGGGGGVEGGAASSPGLLEEGVSINRPLIFNLRR